MQSTVLNKRYRLDFKLGGGSFGVVYRATDLETDQLVAVKAISAHVWNKEVYRKRFIREVEAMRALSHPNIVGYIDAFVTSSQAFIVMEYVEGGTLDDVIARHHRLNSSRCKNIVLQLSDGMAAAHEMGIIHRDLKPANVLVTRQQEPKITDFGLARLKDFSMMTASSTVMGTFAYMSPEALRPRVPKDHRVDIWALGVIFFQLLTGILPFEGETQPEIIASILTGRPLSLQEERKGLPPAWYKIVERCLEKDVEARYSSARQLIADLKRDRFSGSLLKKSTETVDGVAANGIDYSVDDTVRTSFQPSIPYDVTPSSSTKSPYKLRFIAPQPEDEALVLQPDSRPKDTIPGRHSNKPRRDSEAGEYELEPYIAAVKSSEMPLAVMLIGLLFLWSGIVLIGLSGTLLVMSFLPGMEDFTVPSTTNQMMQVGGAFAFSVGLLFAVYWEPRTMQKALYGSLAIVTAVIWLIFFSDLLFEISQVTAGLGTLAYICLIIFYFNFSNY
jgi:serine/threonine protein kinase